jgi:hypothetical protein
MAAFIRLTRAASGDATFVNFDGVLTFKHGPQGGTTIYFKDTFEEKGPMTVTEEPDDILRMLAEL